MKQQHPASLLLATLTVVRAFARLCALRIGPQDIPRSSALLLLTTLVNLSLSTLINRIQLDFGSALLVAVLEMSVLLGLTSALLFYVSHTARAVQTLTALMGSGAVVGAVVYLILTLVPQLPEILRLAIFAWNLIIMAHILRHALAVHFAIGFLIALGYALFLIQLIVFIGRTLGAGAA